MARRSKKAAQDGVKAAIDALSEIEELKADMDKHAIENASDALERGLKKLKGKAETAEEFREKYAKKRFTSSTAGRSIIYSYLYWGYLKNEGLSNEELIAQPLYNAKNVDIVMHVGEFLAGDYETVCDEIREQKATCGKVPMKVILETGDLGSCANIKKASILSMYAGADYIKTSTGKEKVSATPEAAYVMCQAIKEYFQKTGIRVGFKPAGGINSMTDALTYYTIYKEILGGEWMNNYYFRLGTSRLANLVLSDLAGKEVKFF